MATQRDRIRNRKLRAYGMIAVAVLLLAAIIILIATAAGGNKKPAPGTSATPENTLTAAPNPTPTDQVPEDTQSPEATPSEDVTQPATDRPTQPATTRPSNTTAPTTGLTVGGKATVRANELRLREEPSTSGREIMMLKRNYEVTVEALSQGSDRTWTKVTYDGKTGYVKTQYLKASSSAQPAGLTEGGKAVIANVQTDVNFRKEASASSQLLGKPKKGDEVTVEALLQGSDKKWTKITWNGQTGYVMTKYLKAK